MNESLKIIDGKFIISSKKIFMNNINFLHFLFRCDYKKKLKESKPIIKENYNNIETKKRKKRNKINSSNYLYENRNNKLSFSNKNHNKHNKSKSNECYINQNSKKNIILNQILNSVQINLKEKNEKNKNKKKSFNSTSNSNRTSKNLSPNNTIKN